MVKQDNPPSEPIDPEGTFEQQAVLTGKQQWIRAVIGNDVVVAGELESLLLGRASKLNKQRVEEMLRRVSEEIPPSTQLNREMLASEDFFEILRACIEAVAKASAVEKRQAIANYLGNTIKRGVITDLTQQIAEDLKFVQPLHLQILATLGGEEGREVRYNLPSAGLEAMPLNVYNKGISDLLRIGILRSVNPPTLDDIAPGASILETTEYLAIFKNALSAS